MEKYIICPYCQTKNPRNLFQCTKCQEELYGLTPKKETVKIRSITDSHEDINPNVVKVCIRTILVNDHRIIFYGGSLYALKGDKRQKDSDAFENHPATVCEYTHESFMYSPIKPYTSTNGKVLVGVPRAVELLTEKLKEFIATSHPEFEFGKTSSFNFSGQTYFAFEYKIPPLNWKSWF